MLPRDLGEDWLAGRVAQVFEARALELIPPRSDALALNQAGLKEGRLVD